MARAKEVVARCEAVWDVTGLITPQESASPVDVLFSTPERGLVAVAEVKARDLTLAALRECQPPGYLITRRKLEEGREVARQLCVPLLLLVGFWPEREIRYWRISDAEGRWLCPMESARTRTQATCNGGSVVRLNAYLPLNRMLTLRARPAPPSTLDASGCDMEALKRIGRTAFHIIYEGDTT